MSLGPINWILEYTPIVTNTSIVSGLWEAKVEVAVKTLKTGSSVDVKVDFLSEAEMMKRFDHKNIVKLLGVCTRTEPIYTVMEFMLYGDLKT